MDDRYLKVYEHLLRLQELVIEAKNLLTLGESPYTTLTHVTHESELARTAWHTTQSEGF